MTAPDHQPSNPIGEVLAAHRDELLSMPGVVGVGQGEQHGKPCINILVEHGAVELPSELDGYPVSVIESGPITAL